MNALTQNALTVGTIPYEKVGWMLHITTAGIGLLAAGHLKMLRLYAESSIITWMNIIHTWLHFLLNC